MDPDVKAVGRKGVDSYNSQSALWDAEVASVFVYTRHAPLRVHNFGEASAPASPPLRHHKVCSAMFPQSGRHLHSLLTWVDGTGSGGVDLGSA
jgi:hypothetical protein